MNNCLPDETLILFACGGLAPVERARTEEHLARCDRCLVGVAEVARYFSRPVVDTRSKSALCP